MLIRKVAFKGARRNGVTRGRHVASVAMHLSKIAIETLQPRNTFVELDIISFPAVAEELHDLLHPRRTRLHVVWF